MNQYEREEMFKYIRECIFSGLKKDEILQLLEINFNKKYKVGSWKYLRKIAIYGMNLQERQAEYNTYMQKCKEEYQDTQEKEEAFMEQIKYKGEIK